MNWKRMMAVGKLCLLFGTPFLVVTGLFGSGVYVGNLYREPITTFEREWLGLNVEVAKADPVDDEAPSEPITKPSDTVETASSTEAGDPAVDAPPPPVPPKPPESTPVAPTPTPPPVDSEPASPPPRAPEGTTPAPVAAVDPVEGPLATLLSTPVVVGVKVLVDDALVEHRPDWIDYVQRTVSRASAVYQKQFGIELELVAVGRWGVPTEGLSSLALLEDVQARPREAASIIVGLTERPLDDRISGKAFTPELNAPFNASAAVVYANRTHHAPHFRSLLHELGHLFGALDVTDPTSPDYRSGSWMSYAPVPEAQAPWIDAENRARILNRKQRPFTSAAPLDRKGDGDGADE